MQKEIIELIDEIEAKLQELKEKYRGIENKRGRFSYEKKTRKLFQGNILTMEESESYLEER